MRKMTFKRFGTQIDCSRNAVMNVDAVKRWIDLTAAMGHNTLMLYTEDTYEVPEYPYFGYMRGRYSFEELKNSTFENLYKLKEKITLQIRLAGLYFHKELNKQHL